MIKMNKPITIGSLISWLHDQNIDEDCMHRDLYGREATEAITVMCGRHSQDTSSSSHQSSSSHGVSDVSDGVSVETTLLALQCDTCGYGISEEFDAISNRGLLRLFIRMGYLTEKSLPFINNMI